MASFTNYLEKVPTLPLELICEKFKVLTLADILDVSLATEQLRINVRELNLKVVHLEVAFAQELSYIYIRTAHNMSLKWEFHQTLPEGHEQTVKRKIGRNNYRSIKTDEGIATDHYNIEDGIPAVLKHFVSIFEFPNWEIAALSIDMSVIAEFRVLCENFKAFRNIRKLTLTRSGTAPFNPVLLHTIRDFLNGHDMEDVYMGVNTDIDDHLNNRTHHRFQKLLSMDHLKIIYAGWIESDDLLNFTGKTLLIGRDNLIKAEDLNALIKKWLKTDSSELMWLKVDTARMLESDVVLEGLTLEAARRTDTVVKCPFLCSADGTMQPFEWKSSTRQLTRADGSIATIDVTDDCFFFHVSDAGPQPILTDVPPLPANNPNLPIVQIANAIVNGGMAEMDEAHRRLIAMEERRIRAFERAVRIHRV